MEEGVEEVMEEGVEEVMEEGADEEEVFRVENLRFLVVDDEADQVSVVRGPVPQPGQLDPGAAGGVGLELQDGAFTWGGKRERERGGQGYITGEREGFRELSKNLGTFHGN